MAHQARHLVNRSGRNNSRLVIPKNLCGVAGKPEVRIALDGACGIMLKLLPGAVVRLQGEFLDVERRSGQALPKAPARYLMVADQMELSQKNQQLVLDEEFGSDPSLASVSTIHLTASKLR